jgi:hypothetical protein
MLTFILSCYLLCAVVPLCAADVVMKYAPDTIIGTIKK